MIVVNGTGAYVAAFSVMIASVVLVAVALVGLGYLIGSKVTKRRLKNG